ncbi:MAG TPA: hypothetical protein GXX36_11405 [Clostridiaceae bacterium]|nr:hypothetical protein [Clostridiaceae bacterium]
MDNIFIEKLITKKKDAKDYLFTLAICFAGAIVILASPFLSQLVPFLGSIWLLIAAGVIYGIYRFITSRNIEYEYIVTDGDLDIDMIIAQRKRKRIFSANCKEFDVVAPYKSQSHDSRLANATKQIKAVSSMESKGVYFITLNYNGERTAVFFEPDERILKAFKTFIPRKVESY